MSDDLSTYEMTGTRISPKRMEIDTGNAEFVVGKDVNPVEYFLGAILGCLNSTGTMVARDMDIDIEEMTVGISGGVDYSRYRGEESDARPGLQELDVTISIDADADEATLEEWLAAVKDRCPVTDNVENETSLDLAVEAV
ncbi:OsmC family protein [Natranaeroarchaeum sulfidigenes]|uniref:Putative redox protein, regulator of disulfide bond formation n=1 Tax=Natranaeroarchaeum sulfidigenes TaxID=2784880 RepID=A0A897MYJ1_9EURY|nr:OsmC family protein [Natranaeroarchaeum sulfidigenes]QSG03425.1 putative redox protein, regulator of disulfide bond formation [Natranaeroarchaeum sulfidigenes]